MHNAQYATSDDYGSSQDREFDLSIDEILSAGNIAELLTEEQLTTIAMKVIQGYDADEESRAGWLDTMRDALALALQVTETKNFPWPKAANVKMPSLTIAALQFNSRVVPAIMSGNNLIKIRTVGRDPDGAKMSRAKRLELYLSYQILEEDVEWVNEMDSLLMSLPLIGCAFKKVYVDTETGVVTSKFVKPENLCIDYFATCVESAYRITEICNVNHNTMVERQRMGVYRMCRLERPEDTITADMDKQSQTSQGLTPPSITTGNHKVLEQHTYLDLDGDGYEEPYIITVDRLSEKVLRINARFGIEDIIYSPVSKKKDKMIAKIRAEHYYIKYRFLPSPDGGIYDLGWGVLLAPMNKAINSCLNATLDAAHLANTPFGFVGRMVRMKEGELKIAPGRLITLNSTGDDIRKNLFFPDIKGPSTVILSLIQLLLQYTERTSSISDMMVGTTPGQNTPAATSMAVLEQAQKVLNRSYARVFEGCQREYRRRYTLNKLYLDVENYAEVTDALADIDPNDDQARQQALIELAKDFLGPESDVRPAADPTVAGEAQRLAKAEAVRTAAYSGMGYDTFEAERRYMEALNIEAIDKLLPKDKEGKPAMAPGEDPKVTIEKEKVALNRASIELDARHKQMKIDAELNLIEMQAVKTQADAIKAIAQAEATEHGSQVAEYSAHINMLKVSLDRLSKERSNARNNTGDVSGLEGQSSDMQAAGVSESPIGQDSGVPQG